MDIRRLITKTKLDLKKASPTIMVCAGLVLSGAAMIDFCRKSREAIKPVDDFKESIADLKSQHEDPRNNYSDKLYAKDVTEELLKVTTKLAKIYWRPALMWSASTGLIIGSHVMLSGRNAALSVAYAGLGAELRNLHQNIVERYGEDVDRELTYGIRSQEVEDKRVDEDGNEVVEKRQVQVIDGDPSVYSPYARFFDEGSRLWKDDAEYNLGILRARETECNEILRRDGVLFLNTVYEMLDIPKTKAGQFVGWVYYPSGDNPHGDNYVSFHIYDLYSPEKRDFVNGYEKCILLDFNVDGNIVDSLPLI
jgi:hypothetical protein